MKLFKSLFIAVLFISIGGNSQKIYCSLNAGSGYIIHKLELTNYQKGTSIPVYGRFTVGISALEIGAEYFGEASPATYIFKDPNTSEDRFEEQHKQSYYGAFIGINTNSTKEKKAGFFLRAGAGMNNLARSTVLSDEKEYANEKLKSTLELRGTAGFSIPVSTKLSVVVEGLYGRVLKRQRSNFAADLRNNDEPNFSISAYGGLLGLSFRF